MAKRQGSAFARGKNPGLEEQCSKGRRKRRKNVPEKKRSRGIASALKVQKGCVETGVYSHYSA